MGLCQPVSAMTPNRKKERGRPQTKKGFSAENHRREREDSLHGYAASPSVAKGSAETPLRFCSSRLCRLLIPDLIQRSVLDSNLRDRSTFLSLRPKAFRISAQGCRALASAPLGSGSQSGEQTQCPLHTPPGTSSVCSAVATQAAVFCIRCSGNPAQSHDSFPDISTGL